MSARYIVTQSRNSRRVPRCDLPGSPFNSRRQALKAAHKAGITDPRVSTVRRCA